MSRILKRLHLLFWGIFDLHFLTYLQCSLRSRLWCDILVFLWATSRTIAAFFGYLAFKYVVYFYGLDNYFLSKNVFPDQKLNLEFSAMLFLNISHFLNWKSVALLSLHYYCHWLYWKNKWKTHSKTKQKATTNRAAYYTTPLRHSILWNLYPLLPMSIHPWTLNWKKWPLHLLPNFANQLCTSFPCFLSRRCFSFNCDLPWLLSAILSLIMHHNSSSLRE